MEFLTFMPVAETNSVTNVQITIPIFDIITDTVRSNELHKSHLCIFDLLKRLSSPSYVWGDHLLCEKKRWCIMTAREMIQSHDVLIEIRFTRHHTILTTIRVNNSLFIELNHVAGEPYILHSNHTSHHWTVFFLE